MMDVDATFTFADSNDPDSQTINARIIGINHDSATGEMGMTFMMKHSLDNTFYMEETFEENGYDMVRNETDWSGSAMRLELLGTYTGEGHGTIYNLIPDNLKQAAKNVTKYADYTTDETYYESIWAGNPLTVTSNTDKFWLISYSELCGTKDYFMNTYDYFTPNHQYEFFASWNV